MKFFALNIIKKERTFTTTTKEGAHINDISNKETQIFDSFAPPYMLEMLKSFIENLKVKSSASWKPMQ